MTTKSPVFKATYSHIGLCVADIERAKAFYINALGFSEGAVFDADNRMKELLGLAADIDMTSQMMVLDTFVVELIYFNSPTAIKAETPRPMNLLGMTHLSFIVADVDAAAAHLVACGASLLPTTRTTVEFPGSDPTELVFCTDPDGNRIELYKPSSSWVA